MQRVRMSLPYFKEFGWEPTVLVVDPKYSELEREELLMDTVPKDIRIIAVKALSKKITSKFGLGSLALRALYYYRKKVDQLLRTEKYDLIYFSTTQFPLLILGSHWKRKFGIPYVIDMQDPWHSEYYQDKPKNERPKKHWFSYRLNRWLEPQAMLLVDGLISVSAGYIDLLTSRYPRLLEVPKRIITFGAFEPDLKIARDRAKEFDLPYFKNPENYYFLYIGRGGHDLAKAVRLLFTAFKEGLQNNRQLFSKIRFQFIGTSYATKGTGKQTIFPIAEQMGISHFVAEKTDRLPYYHTLFAINEADHLLILGSDDEQYTASKVFPYISASRPLLALFHSKSSAAEIIKDCDAGQVMAIEADPAEVKKSIIKYLYQSAAGEILKPKINWTAFEKHQAFNKCREQCEIFDEVISVGRYE